MPENSSSMRCPVCAGENLTAETDYASFENALRFRNAGTKKKIFGPNDLHVRADRGRVCLDCGYVLYFLSRQELQRLRDSPAGRS